MPYQKTLVGLLTLIAASLSAWSLFTVKPTKNPARPAATTMDAYMEGVVALIMNKQGKPSLKLVTTKMIHYAENDSTDILSPELTIYRPSHQPWFVTSHYAKATQGIDQILFWNKVVIHHPADYSSPATLIKTSSLSVFPEKQFASTQDPITVAQPNMTIRAKGMESDMIAGTVKLLSQTSGEYEPGF